MNQRAFEQLRRRSFRRSLRRLAQHVLAFGEDHLLDQIQVRRVFGQEDELDANHANELAYGFAAGKIVHDDGPGLVDVSSVKTGRSGSMRSLAPLHPTIPDVWMIASAGRSDFFAELFVMDEIPDRPMIELEAALGEFGDKPTQGEVPFPAALPQPGAVLVRNCVRLVPAYLPKRNATVSRKRRIQNHPVQMPMQNCAAAW
jgi:hypothetical protein